MKYTVIFRPNEGITDVYEWHGAYYRSNGHPHLGEHIIGENIGGGLAIQTENIEYRVLGSSVEVDSDDFELEMEFADDEAAVNFADAFNGLCLDPWRVDWMWRDGNDEVYIY